MKLVVGQNYLILDYHQQQSFGARFIGRASNKNSLTKKTLFVVEREDTRGSEYTLAGCEVRCHISPDGEVEPYLYATHYGNTLEDLEQCGAQRYIAPHWVIE